MASNKRPRTSSQSPSPAESLRPQDAVKFAYVPSTVSEEHVITCSLPHAHIGTMSFPSYLAYEEHYAFMHTNRCLSPGCGRNFPSAHFLTLHITENHDPIAGAREARGEKIFSCFVEDCDKVCRDWKKRRSHLVDKHAFPRDYDFLIVNSGIDGRRSLLRPGKDSIPRMSVRDGVAYTSGDTSRGRNASVSMGTTRTDEIEERLDRDPESETTSPYVDVAIASSLSSTGSLKQSLQKRRTSANPMDNAYMPSSTGHREDMDVLTKSMSSLNFVPPSVRFGRSGVKRGLSRQ